MVLSKRERYIAIATAATLGILAMDRVVFDPLMSRKQALDAQIIDAQDKMDRNARLFKKSKDMNKQWSDMLNGGLRRDASNAESSVLNNVRDYAADAGMTLSSLKPERNEKEKDFIKATFRATGTGSMQQLGRFIYHNQVANTPLKITDLAITTRKDGTDDLAIQVGIATTYLAPEPDKNRTATAMTREPQRYE